MSTKIKTRIQNKHDTEANWKLATSFIPLQGELIVYDIDSTHDYERFKIGDGKTVVSALPFSNEAELAKKADVAHEHEDYATKNEATTKVTDDGNGNVLFTNVAVDGAVNLSETDPTVPAWAKQPNKPVYSASEIDGLDTYINEKLGVIENGTY